MGHWYKDGRRLRPEDLPPTKKGELRKQVTEALALEAGAVPGVTDILKFIGESIGLMYWAMNIGIEAALEVAEKYPQMPQDDRSALVKAKAGERREEAAEAGTAIHEAIDGYLSGRIELPEDPVKRTACEEVAKLVEELGLEGEKEYCFSNPSYGGTVDYYDPKWGVLDWKSISSNRKPMLTELAQITAYKRHFHFHNGGLKMGNIYISQSTGKIVRRKFWTPEDEGLGWRVFTLALEIREAYKGFKP